ncbi:PEGA domain-containing protein, partial [Deltaproteobacteria bacterium TL4]
LELPIGSYQMVLTKEGYEALTQKITLEDQKLTSLAFSLKALPAKLALKISRKEGIKSGDGEFRIMLNGDLNAKKSGTPLEKEGKVEEEISEFHLDLPEGQYDLEASHTSGNYEALSKTLSLKKGQSYQEVFLLNPNAAYLKHQAWQGKFYGWLAGSATALLYTQSELNGIQSSKDEADQLKAKTLNSQNKEEYLSNRKKTQAAMDDYNTHQQNSLIGALLTLGLSAWTTIVWLDEPQEPEPVAWQIHPQNGQFLVSYQSKW